MNFIKKIFLSLILVIFFLGFICYLISLLFLFFTFYNYEIGPGNLRKYSPYYITSTILIFSIVFYYLDKKIKEYLIISAVYTIVSLGLFEGYLNFKDVSKNDVTIKQQIYKKKTGKKYDMRGRYEVYKDLKEINNKVKVPIFPLIYLEKPYHNNNSIFPLSTSSNSKMIDCNENGYYTTYHTDRYGFNNPDELWDRKKIEYLLVGDSFTLSQCVNKPDGIASVLRTLSKKPVINLASGGNGPLIEYATLREYLNPNVKKVIWIFYEGNDLKELNIELNNKVLINYINDLTFTQNLKLRQNEVDELANNMILELLAEQENNTSDLQKKGKINLLAHAEIYDLIKSFATLKKKESQLKQVLKLAKDLTIKNNSKLYFIYLPEYNRYKTKYDNSSYFYVKNIVNELNIPFIDIHTELFKKEKKPFSLFPFGLPDHHHNEEGYKKVTETIYKFTNN